MLRHLTWSGPYGYLVAFMQAVVLGAFIVSAAFFWGGLLGSFAAMILIPALTVGAIAIIVTALVKAWLHRRTARKSWIQIGFPILVTCLALPVFVGAVFLFGLAFTWATFAANYQNYEQIVHLAEQGNLPQPGKSAFQTANNGTDFQAEREAPYRIAFPLPGGFLSNWQGILYDPNDIGIRGNAIQGDGVLGDRLDKWWTIESCSRMMRNYFRCSFS